MVRSSNYVMASTLAGLRRLEAQIQRALLEVEPPQGSQSNDAQIQNQKVHEQAVEQMDKAQSVLHNVNLLA